MATRVIQRLLLLGVMLGAVACASKPPVLTINPRQTLVMDASLMAVGVTAAKPDLDRSSSGARAASQLSNTSSVAVTVHYRFYWYDNKGLDVLPYDEVRTVIVPPHAEVNIASTHAGQGIEQVRLYLFL